MRNLLTVSCCATVVLALVACARREPAPRAPETTSGTYPSGSGGNATSWTDEGGPISPGVPSSGDILMNARDGGVIQR